MEKRCLYCNKIFKRNKKVGYKEWESVKFCSHTCYALNSRGRKHTEETKQKISKSNIGKGKGVIPWNKGKKCQRNIVRQ